MTRTGHGKWSVRAISVNGEQGLRSEDMADGADPTPDEAALLVECGVAPVDALLAATLGGAQACFMTDRLGSLETGKYADAVIVEEDPLQDIGALRKVRAVVKEGKVVA